MQDQNPGRYAHTTDADERPTSQPCKGAHRFDLGRRCVDCFWLEEALVKRAGAQFRAAVIPPVDVIAEAARANDLFSVRHEQPSPYSASLPSITPAGSPADNGAAFDAVEAWIAKSPGARTAWCIDRLNGKWRVGLSSDGERLTAGEARTLAQAARNALTIADMAGLL